MHCHASGTCPVTGDLRKGEGNLHWWTCRFPNEDGESSALFSGVSSGSVKSSPSRGLVSDKCPVAAALRCVMWLCCYQGPSSIVPKQAGVPCAGGCDGPSAKSSAPQASFKHELWGRWPQGQWQWNTVYFTRRFQMEPSYALIGWLKHSDQRPRNLTLCFSPGAMVQCLQISVQGRRHRTVSTANNGNWPLLYSFTLTPSIN